MASKKVDTVGVGVKLNRKITVDAVAARVTVCAKPCDAGIYTLVTADGDTLKSHDGYVPAFFPGGGGDYLELDIDLVTGKILNWTAPDARDLQRFLDDEQE